MTDSITVPNWGPAEVKVFRNVLVGGVPTFDGSHPDRDFLAFPSSFIGGAVVAAADMGSISLSSLSANGIGFAAFTDASRTAPVEVAALDTNGDDIADSILAVQGLTYFSRSKWYAARRKEPVSV